MAGAMRTENRLTVPVHEALGGECSARPALGRKDGGLSATRGLRGQRGAPRRRGPGRHPGGSEVSPVRVQTSRKGQILTSATQEVYNRARRWLLPRPRQRQNVASRPKVMQASEKPALRQATWACAAA